MANFPNWIARGLREGTLPWDIAQTTTMSQFLGQYTLHDSCWIDLQIVPQEAAIAVIRWDTIWCMDRVPFPGGYMNEWPILLIRFARMYRVVTDATWSLLGVRRLPGSVDNGIAEAETHLLRDSSSLMAQESGIGFSHLALATHRPVVSEWPVQPLWFMGIRLK